MTSLTLPPGVKIQRTILCCATLPHDSVNTSCLHNKPLIACDAIFLFEAPAAVRFATAQDSAHGSPLQQTCALLPTTDGVFCSLEDAHCRWLSPHYGKMENAHCYAALLGTPHYQGSLPPHCRRASMRWQGLSSRLRRKWFWKGMEKDPACESDVGPLWSKQIVIKNGPSVRANLRVVFPAGKRRRFNIVYGQDAGTNTSPPCCIKSGGLQSSNFIRRQEST